MTPKSKKLNGIRFILGVVVDLLVIFISLLLTLGLLS